MKPINVISLFNGMGTLRQALHNLNIPVATYYSSEIKPFANKLQQYYFPDVIQVGNILNWRDWNIDWATIDLIGSGSPCQDLSIAGKRKGLSGKNSSLFWVFIEILEHVKKFNPEVKFLQENVGSAPKEAVRIISEALDILPVRINSNLVTAQNRDRYYWSNVKVRTDWTGYNWTDIEQPEDRKIFLKDIIESGEVDREKSFCAVERYGFSTTYKDMFSKQAQRCYKRRNEAGFITVVKENNNLRLLTQTELERLQGFPDGYTLILSYNQAASVLGDGWTLPVIEHILNYFKKYLQIKK